MRIVEFYQSHGSWHRLDAVSPVPAQVTVTGLWEASVGASRQRRRLCARDLTRSMVRLHFRRGDDDAADFVDLFDRLTRGTPARSCTETSFQRALVFSQKIAAVTD